MTNQTVDSLPPDALDKLGCISLDRAQGFFIATVASSERA